jgi:hypothetical protein
LLAPFATMQKDGPVHERDPSLKPNVALAMDGAGAAVGTPFVKRVANGVPLSEPAELPMARQSPGPQHDTALAKL